MCSVYITLLYECISYITEKLLPTHTAPPGLASCAVNVSMADGGLVVSCTPGTNGGLPSSYDITVDPGGIQVVINTLNGSIVQNIPGLQPNTTYSVRVVAINCAGNSGEVVMKVTTGGLLMAGTL